MVGKKTPEKQYFMTCENDMKFKSAPISKALLEHSCNLFTYILALAALVLAELKSLDEGWRLTKPKTHPPQVYSLNTPAYALDFYIMSPFSIDQLYALYEIITINFKCH